MRRSVRRHPTSDRRVLAEFALLTLMVTLVTLPVGMLIRGIGSSALPESEALPLMRVGGVERAAMEAGSRGNRAEVAASLDAVAMGFAEPPPPEVSVPEEVASTQAMAGGPKVEVVEERAASQPEVVMFDGRPLKKVKTVTMLVTAYSPDERSCPGTADGITASGYSVWTNGMKLVAADPKLLPMGSVVTVPGYNGGRPVPVLDVGGKIKGKRLDVLYPTHEVALKWGAQRLKVDVWAYAD